MGIDALNMKLQDPEYQEAFKGIFPKDSTKDMKFAVNFFTTIGLMGLTTEIRKCLLEKAASDNENKRED